MWDQMQAGWLGRLKGKEVLTWGERLDEPHMAVLVEPQLAKAAGERQRQLLQSLQDLCIQPCRDAHARRCGICRGQKGLPDTQSHISLLGHPYG